MKKIIILILLVFLSIELSAQSKIVFTIDSPLMGPVKPKYQMIDYSIPFKSVSIIEGAYRGFQFIFSEDENLQEYYRFFIELPEIDKLKFQEVEVRGISGYGLRIDTYCDTTHLFTEKDFSGVYSNELNSYVYPRVNMEKYTRQENDSFKIEYVEFKSFSLKISKLHVLFHEKKNYLSLNAVINGTVFFSSDIRYDAPYELNAVIEINEEKLGMTGAD